MEFLSRTCGRLAFIATVSLATFSSAQTLPPSKITNTDPWQNAEWRFVKYVAPYEPIYFLMGPVTPAAKFQFSLQVHATNWHVVAPSFAFTQTSFWDILGKSAPFIDTSYKPTAFLYFPDVYHHGELWLDLQGGYQHESNGQGGDKSRSMNTIYAQAIVKIGKPTDWHLEITPRVWFYFLDLSDNPDIAKYRGYWNATVRAGWNEYNLRTKVQMGDHLQHAGFQTDFTCPVPGFGYPYLFAQYFAGYGETFLGYKQHTDTIRFGFALHP